MNTSFLCFLLLSLLATSQSQPNPKQLSKVVSTAPKAQPQTIAHAEAEYSAVVSGDIDEVWDVVKNFDNLTWAFNQSVRIISGVNNQIGAMRNVFYGGVVFTDQLRALSYDDYTWTFLMINCTKGFYPGPVANAYTYIKISPLSSGGTYVWLKKNCDTDPDSYDVMAASLTKVVAGIVNCVVDLFP